MKNIFLIFSLILIILTTDSKASFSDKRLSRSKRGFLDKLGQVALAGFSSVTGDACAVRKFWSAYWDIHSTNCDSCDKYFHCRANYDAVHTCMAEDPQGSLRQRIKTAQDISYAREFGQAGQDSEDDQRANRFGRGGGDCAKEYLGKNGCNYDPWRKTCPKTSSNNNNNIMSSLSQSLRGFKSLSLRRIVKEQSYNNYLPSFGFYANDINIDNDKSYSNTRWKWPDK